MRYLPFCLAALFGCAPPPLPLQTTHKPPIKHDVKRKFVLAADLDSAHAAFKAVCARLMLPVDQTIDLQSIQGSPGRLSNTRSIWIGAQTIAVPEQDYADCGRILIEEYKPAWKGSGPLGALGLHGRWVDKLVRSTERPGQARTMDFTLDLWAQGDSVVMLIKTSFADAEQRRCTSKGVFEELIYSLTLNELRP